jgi:hypothetical protein
MKHFFFLFILALTLSLNAQPIQTVVETRGLVLRDQTDAERMIFDGELNLIRIRINDSHLLDIKGGLTASIKCLNLNTLAETGMELNPDGSFAFGEFSPSLPSRTASTLNIRNGLFRPEPDTQAIATGNQERLRINSNGNIGIGVLDPTAKLDINGSLRLRDLLPNENLDLVLAIDQDGNVFSRSLPPLPEGPVNSKEAELNDQLKEQRQLIEALTRRIEKLEKK